MNHEPTRLKTLGLFSLAFLWLTGYSRAQDKALPPVLTLGQALLLAEKVSPDLQAQFERETQARANTGILTAYALPHLDLAGVDSTGFPGSGSPSPEGFGGLVNSPYRSGLAGDAVGTLTLLDASRGYSLTASRYGEKSAQEQTRITRSQVDQKVLGLYLDACRFQGLKQVWQGVVDRIKPIQEIVGNFVRQGRYNEVQLLLLRDQMDQAQLTEDGYDQRYQATLRRLALAAGMESASIRLPEPADLDESTIAAIQEPERNPYLDFAQDEVLAAKALSSSASAERLPRLYVSGSVGLMDSSRLVKQSDYSGWAGISIPVFEGFRIASEEKRAQASLREKSDRLSATQLQVEDLNAQLDEAIEYAREQVLSLGPQYVAATRNFSLAKDRYLKFLGTVTDLEESVRNIARIETEMNDAQTDFLAAAGGKRLLNGGQVNPQASDFPAHPPSKTPGS